MDKKAIIEILRILFILEIIFNNQAAIVKVHDDCRLHELCPLNCVRCDTDPQCYDMSDEFGCGHGVSVFHKLFPGPAIPPGTSLEKLKEDLWLEKIAYIKQHLEKSPSSSFQTSGTFQTHTLYPALSTAVDAKSVQGAVSVFETSGAPLIRYPKVAAISPVAPPQNNIVQSYKESDHKETTKLNFKRFNSRIIYSNRTKTDIQTNHINVPSVYSPKADASSLMNWQETSTGKTTSPEKGKPLEENVQTANAGGLLVPLLPNPKPDPKPEVKKAEMAKPALITETVTPPKVMPPILVQSPKESKEAPVQYKELTISTEAVPAKVQSMEVNTNVAERKEIIFRPEPLPFTASPVSLTLVSSPKITTKQDSNSAVIDSITQLLNDPQEDIKYPLNIQGNDAPTLSLSEVPMSSGVLPTLTPEKDQNPKTEITSQAPKQPSDTGTLNIQPENQVQDQFLPSIPMLPGLIPKLPTSADNSVSSNVGQISYKTGDFFLPVPAVNPTPAENNQAQPEVRPSAYLKEPVDTIQASTHLNKETKIFKADSTLFDSGIVTSANTIQDIPQIADNVQMTDQKAAETQQNVTIQRIIDQSQTEVNHSNTEIAQTVPNDTETTQSTANQHHVEQIQPLINNQNRDFMPTSVKQQGAEYTSTVVTKENVDYTGITNNQQNMEYSQSQMNRQNTEHNQPGITHQNKDSTKTGSNMGSFDQTASMDLISLLFPGTYTPGIAELRNEVTSKPPDVMPDIISNKQTTFETPTVSVSETKGDNGNGCRRVDDYDGFCSSQTHGLFKNNYDCSSYIVCDWGRMHLCRCPKYTMFDSNLQVCNWESFVTC